MALVGLAGRARRARDRRLPLVAVLRLRGLPDHGHPDRDRPDRSHAAAADARGAETRACPLETRGPAPPRSSSGCGCVSPSGAGCASPPTATSPALSNGRSGGPGSRWRSRPASPPHPQVCWLGAAPTGVASEAEYVELGLASGSDPAQLAVRSTPACPPGSTCWSASRRPGREARRAYRRPPSGRSPLDGVERQPWPRRAAAFLAAERCSSNGGRRTGDVPSTLDRPWSAAQVSARPGGGPSGCAIIHLVVRQTTPAVRPDDVLAALSAVAGLPGAAQRRCDWLKASSGGGSIADPLAPDRAAGS